MRSGTTQRQIVEIRRWMYIHMYMSKFMGIHVQIQGILKGTHQCTDNCSWNIGTEIYNTGIELILTCLAADQSLICGYYYRL